MPDRGKSMQKKGKQEKNYYNIRKSHFWILIVSTLIMIVIIYFKRDLFMIWNEKQGSVNVTYDGVISEQENRGECFLCGENNQSLIRYYQKFNAIGLISLNDWYVVDLGLQDYDEYTVTSTSIINTDEVSIMKSSMLNRGMMAIDISLPENYKPNIKLLQEYLCQICLDKVTNSLETTKGKYEKKHAIPLCLVDFQTLEVYALQDWHRGCSIRDYWVEMDYDKDEVEVKIFYLPTIE